MEKGRKMMSKATAKQFLQKIQNDQALKAKLQALSNGKTEGTIAEVARLAAADGFVFTVGEFESALKEHLAQPRPIAAELSEEDLGLVAGGTPNSKTRAAQKKFDDLIRDNEVTEGEYWSIG